MSLFVGGVFLCSKMYLKIWISTFLVLYCQNYHGFQTLTRLRTGILRGKNYLNHAQKKSKQKQALLLWENFIIKNIRCFWVTISDINWWITTRALIMSRNCTNFWLITHSFSRMILYSSPLKTIRKTTVSRRQMLALDVFWSHCLVTKQLKVSRHTIR